MLKGEKFQENPLGPGHQVSLHPQGAFPLL